MRCGKEKKTPKFLAQYLKKDVANTRERLRGAPLYFHHLSSPRTPPLPPTPSRLLHLLASRHLVPIPAQISDVSSASVTNPPPPPSPDPLLMSLRFVLLISRQAGMTAVVSVSGWDIVACFSSVVFPRRFSIFFVWTPHRCRSTHSDGMEDKQKGLTNSRTQRTMTGLGER